MYCLKISYSCLFIQNNTFLARFSFFFNHYFQAWNVRPDGRTDACYVDHSHTFGKEDVYMPIVCIIYYVPSIHNIHQDKMQ